MSETKTLSLINSAQSLPPERVNEFWDKANARDENMCWLWTTGKDRDGYGIFAIKTWPCGAHRVAWVLTHGPIPPGLFVCHSCDTPSCINPAHLFLGTALDNSKDMIDKGRSLTGDRSTSRRFPERLARGLRSGKYTHPEKTPRGEQHGVAKLNDEFVREIRKLYATKQYTQKQLAAQYNVCGRTISLIVRRLGWAHVI